MHDLSHRNATRPRSSRLALGVWSAGFVLLWNTGFIGAEFGLPYSGPFTLLFWRYLALSLVMGFIVLARREFRLVSRRHLASVATVGVLSHGVWLTCALVAIDRGVPAGIVALVVALQPLLTGAFSGFATGEHTSARQWVGSLIQRRRELREPDFELPIALQLLIQSVATAVVLLIPALALESLATEWVPAYAATMVWLVLAVSLGAYALMWRLLSRVSATRIASLFFLGPPVTMLMAWAAFGDAVVATDLLGLAVAGGGVLLVTVRRGLSIPAQSR